jgi:hypothetical protein
MEKTMPSQVAENRLIEHEKEQQVFLEQLYEARAPKPAGVPPQPGKPTQRQLEQIEAEQEAGRRRTRFFEEQAAGRPQPPPDPSEGTMVPVFRPRNYVHETKAKGK